ENVVQGFSENGGQGGDAGRADDAELDPAPEEAAQPAVAFAQEDIIATSLGIEDGDLGQGQRAKEGEQAGHDPDAGNEAKVGDILGDGLWFLEDAGADNRAYDDGSGHQRTKRANETGFRWGTHAGQCKRRRGAMPAACGFHPRSQAPLGNVRREAPLRVSERTRSGASRPAFPSGA